MSDHMVWFELVMEGKGLWVIVLEHTHMQLKLFRFSDITQRPLTSRVKFHLYIQEVAPFRSPRQPLGAARLGRRPLINLAAVDLFQVG